MADRLDQNNNRLAKVKETLRKKAEQKEQRHAQQQQVQTQNRLFQGATMYRVDQPPRESGQMNLQENRQPNYYSYRPSEQDRYYSYRPSEQDRPKQGPKQQIVIKKYGPGGFSKFAKKIENKINQNQKFIRQVIKEAVYSYQKQIKQNLATEKNKLQLDKKQSELLSLFNNQEQQLRQFLDNQHKKTWEIFKQSQYKIKGTVESYIAKKLLLRKVAIVDGKLLHINELKIQERFYHQKYLFLPTTVDNLYVRLDSSGNLTKVNFLKGQFLDLEGVKKMNEKMKEQILGMVLLYLKDEGIFIQIDQHHQIASQINRMTTLIAKKP